MKKIRFVRESMGLTQFHLGKLVDIRPNRISYFEHGWAKPTPEEAKRIADYLKLGPNELLEEVSIQNK
jgi:transcriptional regulator with XRE-family HTH domain